MPKALTAKEYMNKYGRKYVIRDLSFGAMRGAKIIYRTNEKGKLELQPERAPRKKKGETASNSNIGLGLSTGPGTSNSHIEVQLEGSRHVQAAPQSPHRIREKCAKPSELAARKKIAANARDARNDAMDDAETHQYFFGVESDSNEQRAPSRKRRNAYEKWQRSREAMWQSLSLGIPDAIYRANKFSRICSLNGCTSKASVFCVSCLPLSSFCNEHAEMTHSEKIFCHLLAEQEGKLVDFVLQNGPCLGGCLGSHDFKELHVVLPEGKIKTLSMCWKGIGEAERAYGLMQLGLWPSTPTRPTLSYALQFLETVYFLNIEGGLSIQKILNSFKYRNAISDREFCKIYDGMTNGSFIAYKEHRLLWDPSYHVGCLACPEEMHDMFVPSTVSCATFERSCFQGEQVLADPSKFFVNLDAMFSCGRLNFAGKTAGRSQPSEDPEWIFEPKEVGLAVKSGTTGTNALQKDCSVFSAITLFGQKNQTQKYDVTGIFEASCEHHCTIKTIDMFGGEGYGFAGYLIPRLTEAIPENIQLFLSYDIACMVRKYLEKNCPFDVLSKVQLYVPTFHAYGHTKDCQRKNSARVTSGVGLVDGEGQERIWAYKKGLDSSVKVMTEQGRRNVLTHAGLHTRTRSLQSLGAVLLGRYDRAAKLLPVVEENLNSMLMLHEGVCESTVDRWEAEERAIVVPDRRSDNPNLGQTVEKYVERLEEWHDFHKNCDYRVNEFVYTRTLAKRLDEELLEFERKLGIERRYQTDDVEFAAVLHQVLQSKRLQIRETLRSHAIDYYQVQCLRGKIQTGQSVRRRFDTVLTGLAKRMRDCVEAYNGLPERFGTGNIPSRIQFDSVKNIADAFYGEKEDPGSDISLQFKREVVETRHLLRRYREELEHLKICAERASARMEKIKRAMKVQIESSNSENGKSFYMKLCAQKFEKKVSEFRKCAVRMGSCVDDDSIDELLAVPEFSSEVEDDVTDEFFEV